MLVLIKSVLRYGVFSYVTEKFVARRVRSWLDFTDLLVSFKYLSTTIVSVVLFIKIYSVRQKCSHSSFE